MRRIVIIVFVNAVLWLGLIYGVYINHLPIKGDLEIPLSPEGVYEIYTNHTHAVEKSFLNEFFLVSGMSFIYLASLIMLLNMDAKRKRYISRVELLTEAIKESEEKYRNLFDNSLEAVFTVDLQGNITSFNRAVMALSGYSEAELAGSNFSRYTTPEVVQSVYSTYNEIFLTGKPNHSVAYEIFRKDGSRRIVEGYVSPIKKGRVFVGFQGTLRDVTEQALMADQIVKMNEELRALSITDELTGLYNRRYFYKKMHEEMGRAVRKKRSLSLALFDLDYFKRFNDTFGHLEGDDALRSIATAIRSCTREDMDSACRYGGDEFAVILPEVGREQAELICQRICDRIEELKIGEISASVGLAEFNFKEDIGELIKRADDALYREKRCKVNDMAAFSKEGR
ncbi:MAG: diguanylate cyclase [Smithellaceae bacterium]|nr:diguanylate cyclase [Smithellaceae bacterium]